MTGPATPAVVLMVVWFWATLWLGLVLLSGVPRSRVSLLMGLTVVGISTYLLGSAVLGVCEDRSLFVLAVKWLGCWSCLPAALYLHAVLLLTGARFRGRSVLLLCAYGSGVVFFAASFSDRLIYDLSDVSRGPQTLVAGPWYPLLTAQITLVVAAALLVLEGARRGRRRAGFPGRRGDGLLVVGTATILAGVCLLLANALAGFPLVEAYLQPVLLLGLLLAGIPMGSHAGLVEGQLRRGDLRASFIGATIVMAVFSALVAALGGPVAVAIGMGWVVLVVYVASDRIRAAADRAVFGAGRHAASAGLRAAAGYAGSGAALDLEALAPGQDGAVLAYLGEVDRAALAAASLEGERDPRLGLLGQERFAAVREALGLPAGWVPADGISPEAVRAAVAGTLRPRQRQALGLRYLGYSDKEMAALMDVRAGVPRSYLGDARQRLGLPAGAELTLFTHFAGLAEEDALPLLAAAEGA